MNFLEKVGRMAGYGPYSGYPKNTQDRLEQIDRQLKEKQQLADFNKTQGGVLSGTLSRGGIPQDRAKSDNKQSAAHLENTIDLNRDILALVQEKERLMGYPGNARKN
jgi:hypothetical protein